MSEIYEVRNNVITVRKGNEYRAFCPGEFDALDDYAPELMLMARSLWTPEVISAWEQRQAEKE